ncbi:MAG: iduronate sulfatase, partial [Candidatus Bathyarchaeota archaeon]
MADSVYYDGWVATEAIDEIVRLNNSSSHYFLAVGFKKPHLPFNVPQKYWDLYNTEEIDLPPIRRQPYFAPSFA